jgi:hypothetical protein
VKLIARYRQGVVVGVESIFCWYWLADLCQQEQIAFVLGHAFYMKLIHGGKGKNDRLDAGKLARLLHCGSFPLAYAYPQGMRETRDLLRRRLHLVRQRSGLLTHIQIVHSQYNLLTIDKNWESSHAGVAERFASPSVRQNVSADLRLVHYLSELVAELEDYLRTAWKLGAGNWGETGDASHRKLGTLLTNPISPGSYRTGNWGRFSQIPYHQDLTS